MRQMTKMVKYEDLNGPRWNPFDFRLKIGKKWWSSAQFQKGFTPFRLEGHFWPFRPFGRKNCQNAWFASQINDFLYYSCIFPFLALFCHLLYVLLTMSSPPPLERRGQRKVDQAFGDPQFMCIVRSQTTASPYLISTRGLHSEYQ